jgi:hypothetical protein
MNSMIRRFHIRFLSCIGSMILSVSLSAVAQDTEGELFNQLYREIISSAADGGVVTMDSLFPRAKPEQLRNENQGTRFLDDKKSDDAAAEQLKEEIDRMVGEVRTRHSEKVRFMQDGNGK